ncbi:MAG: hypothetical protein K0B11_21710, partial [Mariniphaga sp.]|nr:hypothetical protein [Mariniphaga sp.]
KILYLFPENQNAIELTKKFKSARNIGNHREKEVGICLCRKRLQHESSKATEMYTDVFKSNSDKFPNPFDDLVFNSGKNFILCTNDSFPYSGNISTFR